MWLRGTPSLSLCPAACLPARLPAPQLLEAARGMLYLHLCDPPILHRGLKSANLLVDSHWRCKVRGAVSKRQCG